ncbi:MAG: PQQ-binding-like beta-propeller repeat protein, partial [Fimbriiglobus sp.]
KNIRWTANVGSRAIGGPVVANGLVWVGTNNESLLDPKITDDRGVYACFRESDGRFLGQYASPRLELGKMIADWPTSGTGGSPVVEGDRVWLVTNRREVVCLDSKPLSQGTPARVVWKYDLIQELGVFPNSPMIPSPNNVGSPVIHQDWLYVPTGNGVDVDHPGAQRVRAPKAPSLVCFHKTTGKVVWKDNSPGLEGFGGHHASPLIFQHRGKALVVHPQADGWVRAFDAGTGALIWKFDINHKSAKWDWQKDGLAFTKAVVVGNPVLADGRLYFAAGREPEFAGGPGRLFCIDPTKTGDVSPELEDGKANPASALLWDFQTEGKNTMLQTVSSVAVSAGLVIAPDRYGHVHCLDARTGKHHWSHDTKGGMMADPLIVDDKIYIGNDNGLLTILERATTRKVVQVHDFDRPIVASPSYANGTLFIQTEFKLYAIAKPK